MKKLLAGFAVFLITLFAALAFLLPYKDIYDNLINKYVQNMQLQAYYNITNASLFSLNTSNVSIKKDGYLFHFDKIKAKVSPFKYLFGENFLRLQLRSAADLASVAIKKNKNLWYITIKTPSSMFKSVVKNFQLPFPIQGDLLIKTKIKNEGNQLLIKKISVRGQINIDARGYIKNYHLRLNGKIKFGKMEQEFNFDQRL
ncbi:MAG: hypothetical protein IEMM0003_0922 [bacterium]|nr:MAG: hypothetical protein IEMM0003_0922 [bacterium]